MELNYDNTHFSSSESSFFEELKGKNTQYQEQDQQFELEEYMKEEKIQPAHPVLQEDPAYTVQTRVTMDTQHIYDTAERHQLQEYNEKSLNTRAKPQQQLVYAVGKVPLVVQTVLQVLILMLLVALLGLILTQTTEDTSVTSAMTSGNSNSQRSPNFTEWADGVAQNVFQLLNSNSQRSPNFTEWADGVAQSNTLVLNQIIQLLNTTQSTARKVDNIGSLAEDEIMYQENTTKLLNQLLAVTGSSAQKLTNIVGTLSNLKDTSTSTAGVVDDILLVVEELLELHNGSSALPTSCQEIKKKQPNSPSGVYLVATTNGGATYTYCNMEELCGSGGGWTRLAYLDMSDATENCPSGFRLYQTGGVRACGRATTSSGSCQSVQFPSNGISYSQVCGRVVGYQYGTPDAVDSTLGGSQHHNNLNSYYVDGVSITRGSPRQHVWTLMAGLQDSFIHNARYNCPCSNGTISQVQSFIGTNNFCESGNHDSSLSSTLYTSDPLWDGQGCVSLETACCSAPGLPWFHRDYGNTTTTDYLELRVCGDQSTSDENVPVSYYEIYVK